MNDPEPKQANKFSAFGWVMTQTWTDLLFAHWPVPAEVMRNHIPAMLKIDTYEKYAWVTIAPFAVSKSRLRLLPPIPFVSRFLQLNLRTYVVYNNQPGVYFLSLDANSRIAAGVARSFLNLPFYSSCIDLQKKGSQFHFCSRRASPESSAEFSCLYQPVSSVFHAQKDSLDGWLTERYVMYFVRRQQIYRGDLFHFSWPLQYAEAEISINTLPETCGFRLQGSPALLHYANSVKAYIGPPGKDTNKNLRFTRR